MGHENFVADRDQVREVLMLPDAMTRVPGAKRWLLGIANLRGHLLPLMDLKMYSAVAVRPTAGGAGDLN